MIEGLRLSLEKMIVSKPSSDGGGGSSLITKRDSWKRDRKIVTGRAVGVQDDSIEEILPPGVELQEGEKLSTTKPLRKPEDVGRADWQDRADINS